jgi:hypothetical protein
MHLFTGGSISWHHRCVTPLYFYNNGQQRNEAHSAIMAEGKLKSRVVKKLRSNYLFVETMIVKICVPQVRPLLYNRK